MMKIGSYSIDEFTAVAQSFHGVAAPGVLIGGFMVDALLRRLENGHLYDAICETQNCLPDAIQLLTPCTIGNGWLKVINLGRFALTLYEKTMGHGIRAFVDTSKIKTWPEINDWYYKRKKKDEQDFERLVHEINTAGARVCSFSRVRVRDRYLKKMKRGDIATCPVCNEGYPYRDGPVCLACQGGSPYRNKRGWGGPSVVKLSYPEQRACRHVFQDTTESIRAKQNGGVDGHDQSKVKFFT